MAKPVKGAKRTRRAQKAQATQLLTQHRWNAARYEARLADSLEDLLLREL